MSAIVSICFLLAILGYNDAGCWAAGGDTVVRNITGGESARQPAPDIVLKTLDDKAVSLADYKGKALIVTFWATWNGYCKLEMPWLAQLRQQSAPQGFGVLGILTDNAPPEKILNILTKDAVRYPVAMCHHKTAQACGGLPDACICNSNNGIPWGNIE